MPPGHPGGHGAGGVGVGELEVDGLQVGLGPVARAGGCADLLVGGIGAGQRFLQRRLRHARRTEQPDQIELRLRFTLLAAALAGCASGGSKPAPKAW